MKVLTFTLFLSLLTAGCGEKRGNKLKRTNFPKGEEKLEEFEYESIDELMVNHIQGKSLQLRRENEALFSTSKIQIKEKRFLRSKLLNQAFMNLRNDVPKQKLNLTYKDEFRFFIGELKQQNRVVEGIKASRVEEELGSWRFKGTLSFKGISRNEKISDVFVGIGGVNANTHKLIYFGKNFLRGKNGRALAFNSKKSSSFELDSLDLSIKKLSKLFDLNSHTFLEVIDFNYKEKSFNDYQRELREDKTRMIISLPNSEKLFFLNEGESISEFLTKLDPDVKYNFDGSISNLLEKEQDLSILSLDRETFDDLEFHGDKKIWWCNLEEGVEGTLAGERTIVLIYASINELRETQLTWSKLDFKMNTTAKKVQLNGNKTVGVISKASRKYSYTESTAVIPYEIGVRECMEDFRTERKAVDCYIAWSPASSYPTARFRNQSATVSEKREIMSGEFEFNQQGLKHGDFVEVTKKGELALVKLEKPSGVSGGFIGWVSYHPDLNRYKTRAVGYSLATTTIKSGYSNEYTFSGWEQAYTLED